MSSARKLRVKCSKQNLVFISIGVTICLVALSQNGNTQTGKDDLIMEPVDFKDVCVRQADLKLDSFVKDIDNTCADSRRQRKCQERLSRWAIPNLVEAKLEAKCDAGCLFHAIVSEAGGKMVNRLAFSAFLRAFIVTQPQESELYIWSLPWDDIKLPDIAQGCSAQNLNVKLVEGTWRNRIKFRKFEHAHLGVSNVLKMSIYRFVGNEFRLLRSMVRLSDLLRFHLLKQYGGIYLDSDMLLLRDLTPLCNATFTYQWSDKDADNSAIFGCPKNCRFVNQFIRNARSNSLSYHPLKWRENGKRGISRWPVRLPTMVFDPVWLKQIGSDLLDPADYIFTRHEEFVRAGTTPLQIDSRANAFPASLAYHWHGGFASIPERPEPQSTFSQLHSLACF